MCGCSCILGIPAAPSVACSSADADAVRCAVWWACSDFWHPTIGVGCVAAACMLGVCIEKLLGIPQVLYCSPLELALLPGVLQLMREGWLLWPVPGPALGAVLLCSSLLQHAVLHAHGCRLILVDNGVELMIPGCCCLQLLPDILAAVLLTQDASQGRRCGVGCMAACESRPDGLHRTREVVTHSFAPASLAWCV